MHQGEVIEKGTHSSLINARGTYFNLVEQQNLLQSNTDSIPLSNQPLTKLTSIVNSSSSPLSIALPTSDNDPRPERKRHVQLTMFQMNRPEWWLIAVGCLACVINGGIQPAIGIILSKMTMVFQECDQGTKERRILLFVLLFIGFGLVSLVTLFIQVRNKKSEMNEHSLSLVTGLLLCFVR